MKEYLILIAQVERQKNQGQLQLQRLWHLVQPTMQTIQIIASIVSDINKSKNVFAQ